MSSGQDGHFVNEPLFPSFEVIGTEEVIGDYHSGRHEPDDPPKVAVPSLAYPALSLILARFICSWIQPCLSDQLPVIFESPHISSQLNKEVQCRFVSNALRGGEDLCVSFHLLI